MFTLCFFFRNKCNSTNTNNVLMCNYPSSLHCILSHYAVMMKSYHLSSLSPYFLLFVDTWPYIHLPLLLASSIWHQLWKPGTAAWAQRLEEVLYTWINRRNYVRKGMYQQKSVKCSVEFFPHTTSHCQIVVVFLKWFPWFNTISNTPPPSHLPNIADNNVKG